VLSLDHRYFIMHQNTRQCVPGLVFSGVLRYSTISRGELSEFSSSFELDETPVRNTRTRGAQIPPTS
jgi:hypothetical protein